jgi:hypothetical protein
MKRRDDNAVLVAGNVVRKGGAEEFLANKLLRKKS